MKSRMHELRNQSKRDDQIFIIGKDVTWYIIVLILYNCIFWETIPCVIGTADKPATMPSHAEMVWWCVIFLKCNESQHILVPKRITTSPQIHQPLHSHTGCVLYQKICHLPINCTSPRIGISILVWFGCVHFETVKRAMKVTIRMVITIWVGPF